MPDVLAKICADKLLHIAARKKVASIEELKEKIKRAAAPRKFAEKLQEKIAAGKFALIAEIKKASPSKGVIRDDFTPAKIAADYKNGGAACLSVLTDEKYFSGKDEYLQIAKEAASLPVLRKDFIIDPYQIYESRALGADCILLIIAALDITKAKELEKIAIDLGMDVLIETHDEKELEIALDMKSKLIGINNRDLKTLRVDTSTTLRLAKKIPDAKIAVCESGIETNGDLQIMRKAGVNCFLVGESLMRQQNIELATKNLLGAN